MVVRPVHAVHQQNVEPAVPIVVEESATRPHGFRQIPGAEGSAVVVKLDAGGRRNIGQTAGRRGESSGAGNRRQRGCARQEPSTRHAMLTNPWRIAWTTSSAVL